MLASDWLTRITLTSDWFTGQDTLWLPQARLPASNAHAQSGLGPDASLAMNDLALKYLTDAELGQLAAVHQPKENKGDAIKMSQLFHITLHYSQGQRSS